MESYQLPLELKYLPVIESAPNPGATSRVGAAGLWQFMISTGKVYGLDVNSLIDERRDPIKSRMQPHITCKTFIRFSATGLWSLQRLQLRAGQRKQGYPTRRGKQGLLANLSLSSAGNKRLRIGLHCRQLRHELLLRTCNICPMTTTLPPSTDTIIVDRDVHFDQIGSCMQRQGGRSQSP